MAHEALADTVEFDTTAPTSLASLSLESGEPDIPVLKAVVQSGDIDLINSVRSARQSQAAGLTPESDPAYESAIADGDTELPEWICESDLESTIDAIVEQHLKSIKAELRAVIAMHLRSQDSD